MTDDQLETLLARQGEAWRAAQPAAPSLSAMTGTPPARAPWLVPVLVAAALVVPVVGTVVLVQRQDPAVHQIAAPPSAPSAPVVVPWADLPATAPVSPNRLDARVEGGDEVAPSGTTLCKAGDFSATSDSATSIGLPGALGSGRYMLTVQRVGTGPCAIGADTPTMNILDAAGHSLGIGRSSLLVWYTGYTLLQPGDVLQVPAKICGTGVAAVELRMQAPLVEARAIRQPPIPVTIPFPRGSTCTSGGKGTVHQRIVPAGGLGSLVPGFSVPRRVRSGQTLDYSVTLTNPTSVAVSLDPCPSYRQSLIDLLKLPDKKGSTSTGRLNCAAAPASVPAHGSITFRLRLETAGVPAGDRRLVWDWLGSSATDAQGYAQFPTVTVY
ncbi:MAG: hypothetical protein QOE23_1136 [Pseudonocardiales bacterium]|jgi:hypothetical protein|nr:hypothetical protein [Pseudonocardiales bacterium]